MLNEIRITHRDQWQIHGASVGHVGRGVQPVLKEEEQGEDERRGLALREKVCGQEKRHQPLQDGSTPQSRNLSEPPEKKMAALVHHQIRQVDKEKFPVFRKRISQKDDIKQKPPRKRNPRYRLPASIVSSLPGPIHPE